MFFQVSVVLQCSCDIASFIFVENCPVWGEWSAWTSCNVTCGGGMQTASRSCANGNAGQAGCEGGAYKYRDCANQACRLTAGE